MTKAPTPEDRRAARQAQLAEEARARAEAAREDAALNLPVLQAALADVETLGEVSARLNAHAEQLLATSDGAALWIGQADTLVQLQANLKTIGEALITHANTVLGNETAA